MMLNCDDVCDWLREGKKRWAVRNRKTYVPVAVTTTYEQAECLANLSKDYYVEQLEDAD